MRYLIVLSLLIVLTSSCVNEKNQVVDEARITFKTDDSTKLFFKNLRQAYYDVEVMDEAKLEVYRHKKRTINSELPIINLCIVNNWRYDEAYILIEPNEAVGSLTDLSIKWKNTNGETGEIKLDGQNKMSQALFASKIYEQLINASEFSLIQDNDEFDILKDTKSREAFRITMFDYFRLTSVK